MPYFIDLLWFEFFYCTEQALPLLRKDIVRYDQVSYPRRIDLFREDGSSKEHIPPGKQNTKIATAQDTGLTHRFMAIADCMVHAMKHGRYQKILRLTQMDLDIGMLPALKLTVYVLTDQIKQNRYYKFRKLVVN